MQGSGLRVAVLDHVVPAVGERCAASGFASAINAASEKLLTRLGAYGQTLWRDGRCYHGMEVWDKDSAFGRITFDDAKVRGYSHLGHIVGNSVIHYALWQKRSKRDITLMAPAELPCWRRPGRNGTPSDFLKRYIGAMLTARLVILRANSSGCVTTKRISPLTSGTTVTMR
ncbi:hypothetical protein KCP71_10970 [Salmonella enterica subsp. enterica]|nr:hypothetical protein KCP71_10970 [Salmonella enterica subsp. enterica]